jgi:hypothetical protein
MIKRFFGIILVCLSVAKSCSAESVSAEALAEAFMKAVTSQRGSLFPAELIYPDNLAALPVEQIAILGFMPALRLFDREDLEYRIAPATSSKRHPGLEYSFPPSHVIVITHVKWQRDVPALSVDIAKLDGSWWIVVPKLSAEVVEIVKSGISHHEQQVEELTKKVQPNDVRPFKEALNGPDKYRAIVELVERFNVSREAAILFLSELKRMDEQKAQP